MEAQERKTYTMRSDPPGSQVPVTPIGKGHKLDTRFGKVCLFTVHIPMAKATGSSQMYLTYACRELPDGKLEMLGYAGGPEKPMDPITEDKALLKQLWERVEYNLTNVDIPPHKYKPSPDGTTFILREPASG